CFRSLTHEKDDEPLTLVPLTADTIVAVGTANGVVKRITPQDPPNRDAWEIISLKDGDRVIGAAVAADDAQLVFVTDDGQLSHFSATTVRPQGRSGGGVAGIKLAAGARALHFTAVTNTAD